MNHLDPMVHCRGERRQFTTTGIATLGMLLRRRTTSILETVKAITGRGVTFGPLRGTRLVVQLICPRCFEPWLCELRDRIVGRPERFELCGADVTEVAVSAFDVVEVVDVVGHGGGQLDGGGPSAGVEQLVFETSP
jgi:hypothetical protein